MVELVLFGTFFVLLFLSVPVAFAIGLAAFVAVLVVAGTSGLSSLPGVMQNAMVNETLLAIPFFILAGVVMEYTGISQRLIDLANSLVGRFKTGLALVVIIAAFFFSAISGSGPATVAAIGSIVIPAMVRRGYRPSDAAALLASSGSLGIVIPPSITLIIFGVIASEYQAVSISRLFIAAIVPGLLLAVAIYMVVIFRHRRMLVTTTSSADAANLESIPAGQTVRPAGAGQGPQTYIDAGLESAEGQVRALSSKVGRSSNTLRSVSLDFLRAIPGLLVPVIILGGIYSGIFTPTESAVVAVVYALIVGVLIYRDLKIGQLYKIGITAVVQSSVVLIIVGSASMFGYVVTRENIATTFADAMFALSTHPVPVMFICIVLLVIIGAFIDAVSALYLFVPILVPVLLGVGYDITTLGVMMTVALALGLMTPPVGVNLFVAAGLAKTTLWDTAKSAVPYMLAAMVVTVLVAFVPALSNWLPDLLLD